MAVEPYGCWGPETQSNFSLFASHLSIEGGGGGGVWRASPPSRELFVADK